MGGLSKEEVEAKLIILRAQGLSITLECFIRLHFAFGLRISDLLRIRRADISESLLLVVQQGKGSQPLVCHLSEDKEFWQGYRMGKYVDISLFSRDYFYKLYRRVGWSMPSVNGVNRSVTHAPRKLLAQELFEASSSIDVVASALGHRSSSSSLYYLTSAQKKKVVVAPILSTPPTSIYNLIIKKRKSGDIIYLK